MGTFKDQLSREVFIPPNPQKIISLVPSQTELLFTLGLGDRVAGITKFCLHPDEWFRTKTRIGGTKNVNLPKIREINPDLILANKEENPREQIEELEKHYPVWVSDISTLDDALAMIRAIGEICNTQSAAEELAGDIAARMSQLSGISATPKMDVCYLIWQEPFMTIGGDSFINEMLNLAGYRNVFADLSRYPQLSEEELRDSSCEMIFLASEPYPFKQRHIDELSEKFPAKKFVLVDGEMFSWYGSRLLLSADYFRDLRARISAIS